MNVHEAKTHLSRLLDRAMAGDDVTIARAGTPLVRLVPVSLAAGRPLGLDAGRIQMADDFDAPPHAAIHEVIPAWLPACGDQVFVIRSSDAVGARTAVVLPDIATMAPCSCPSSVLMASILWLEPSLWLMGSNSSPDTAWMAR